MRGCSTMDSPEAGAVKIATSFPRNMAPKDSGAALLHEIDALRPAPGGKRRHAGRILGALRNLQARGARAQALRGGIHERPAPAVHDERAALERPARDDLH